MQKKDIKLLISKKASVGCYLTSIFTKFVHPCQMLVLPLRPHLPLRPPLPLKVAPLALDGFEPDLVLTDDAYKKNNEQISEHKYMIYYNNQNLQLLNSHNIQRYSNHIFFHKSSCTNKILKI